MNAATAHHLNESTGVSASTISPTATAPHSPSHHGAQRVVSDCSPTPTSRSPSDVLSVDRRFCFRQAPADRSGDVSIFGGSWSALPVDPESVGEVLPSKPASSSPPQLQPSVFPKSNQT